MLQFVQVVLSAIVLIMVVVALLMSKPKAPLTHCSGKSAQSERILELLETLSFGSQQGVIVRSRRRTQLEKVLESFDQALTIWLKATPQSYRPVFGGEISACRKSLARFTPHVISSDAAQARLEANTIMRNAAKFCLIATDRDLDRDHQSELLQSPLEDMIKAAGLTIIDPPPGTIWPPYTSGTRMRGKKVVRANTRGLASDQHVFLEPEIQEAQ